jgi:hypothetical protein
MADDGVGLLGGVVVVGGLYWVTYGLALVITMAVIGFLVIAIVGIISAFTYFRKIHLASRDGNALAARALLIAPAVLTGTSLLATILWSIGGPSFIKSVMGPLIDAGDGSSSGFSPWEILIFVVGAYALVGWIIPLAMVSGLAQDESQWPSWAREKPTEYAQFAYVTAFAWGIIGGSSFAIAALM